MCRPTARAYAEPCGETPWPRAGAPHKHRSETIRLDRESAHETSREPPPGSDESSPTGSEGTHSGADTHRNRLRQILSESPAIGSQEGSAGSGTHHCETGE